MSEKKFLELNKRFPEVNGYSNNPPVVFLSKDIEESRKEKIRKFLRRPNLPFEVIGVIVAH